MFAFLPLLLVRLSGDDNTSVFQVDPPLSGLLPCPALPSIHVLPITLLARVWCFDGCSRPEMIPYMLVHLIAYFGRD